MSMPIGRGLPLRSSFVGAFRSLHRRSMRYARRMARFARRRTRERRRPESDWMRAGKRAMCVSARRKEPGRHESSPSDAKPDELYDELASLPALGPERLKERWRILYGTETPTHQRDLLDTRSPTGSRSARSAASSLPRADCSSGSPRAHDRARHRPRRPASSLRARF